MLLGAGGFVLFVGMFCLLLMNMSEYFHEGGFIGRLPDMKIKLFIHSLIPTLVLNTVYEHVLFRSIFFIS